MSPHADTTGLTSQSTASALLALPTPNAIPITLVSNVALAGAELRDYVQARAAEREQKAREVEAAGARAADAAELAAAVAAVAAAAAAATPVTAASAATPPSAAVDVAVAAGSDASASPHPQTLANSSLSSLYCDDVDVRVPDDELDAADAAVWPFTLQAPLLRPLHNSSRGRYSAAVTSARTMAVRASHATFGYISGARMPGAARRSAILTSASARVGVGPYGVDADIDMLRSGAGVDTAAATPASTGPLDPAGDDASAVAAASHLRDGQAPSDVPGAAASQLSMPPPPAGTLLAPAGGDLSYPASAFGGEPPPTKLVRTTTALQIACRVVLYPMSAGGGVGLADAMAVRHIVESVCPLRLVLLRNTAARASDAAALAAACAPFVTGDGGVVVADAPSHRIDISSHAPEFVAVIDDALLQVTPTAAASQSRDAGATSFAGFQRVGGYDVAWIEAVAVPASAGGGLVLAPPPVGSGRDAGVGALLHTPMRQLGSYLTRGTWGADKDVAGGDVDDTPCWDTAGAGVPLQSRAPTFVRAGGVLGLPDLRRRLTKAGISTDVVDGGVLVTSGGILISVRACVYPCVRGQT